MKLTVGPLPPAVYWRRRAVIAGTLLVLVIALIYSCSGSSGTRQKSGRNTAVAPASRAPSPTPTATGSVPALTPSDSVSPVPDDPAPPASDSPAPAQSGAATGSCTDEEMSVTAIPEAASVARGAFVKLTLRIKNTSNRTCTRDVGADAQELYLVDSAKAKVWSSDACSATPGTDVRTFKPAIEAEFFVTWDGKATNGGCGSRAVPAAGKYELVGRLATKVGEAAPLELK